MMAVVLLELDLLVLVPMLMRRDAVGERKRWVTIRVSGGSGSE